MLLAVGWLTSATRPFVSDVGNLVGVVVQFGFWLTPVVWHMDSMPAKLQAVLKLVPTYYLASGYRDALFQGPWFWERWQDALVFWAFTGILLVAGQLVFRRLEPHFAEVL